MATMKREITKLKPKMKENDWWCSLFMALWILFQGFLIVLMFLVSFAFLILNLWQLEPHIFLSDYASLSVPWSHFLSMSFTAFFLLFKFSFWLVFPINLILFSEDFTVVVFHSVLLLPAMFLFTQSSSLMYSPSFLRSSSLVSHSQYSASSILQLLLPYSSNKL